MAVRATITIEYHDNGDIKIQAPMDNKVMCYGMLEFAKDLVRATKPKAAPLIQPANSAVAPVPTANGQ